MGTYNFNKKEEKKETVETSTPQKKPGLRKRIYNFITTPIFGLITGSLIFTVALTILILTYTVFYNTNGLAPVQADVTYAQWEPDPHSMGREHTEIWVVKVTFQVDGSTYNDVNVSNTHVGINKGDKIEVWYHIDNPKQDVKLIDATAKLVPSIICGLAMAGSAGFIIYHTVDYIKDKKASK